MVRPQGQRQVVEEPTGAPVAPAGLRSRILRVTAAVVAAAAIVVLVVQQWDDVRPLLGRLTPLGVVAATVAVLAGIFATFLCWRAILGALGSTPPIPGAMRIFFVGQLGKYVPGSIWPVVAQIHLGRDYRIPPRASGAAFVTFMITLVGTGVLVAVPTMPLLSGAAIDRYWWTWLALPLAAVALAPPVANRALSAVLRLTRRRPLPRPLDLAGTLSAAGWALISWLAYGLHAWVLMRELGSTGGATFLVMLTGAFAAAWCIGFLVVIAPAGAGVREAALIVLIGATVPEARVTAFAIVSRLLFTFGDVAWSLAAHVWERRRRIRGRHLLPAYGGPDSGPRERLGDLPNVGDA
jgi:hypothetical protein